MADHETRLEIKEIIPPFQLMSAEDKPVNTRSFKQKKNLILVFISAESRPDCIEFLRGMIGAHLEYQDEHTEALVVVRGDQQAANKLHKELHPPFPILYDAFGIVTNEYTDRLPAVIISDRHGRLYAEWIVGEGGSFPTHKELLDTIDLMNLEYRERNQLHE